MPKNTFARVGMSHVTKGLHEPYIHKMAGKNGIAINNSFQPNSNPHFGTITTLMCVMSIAQEMRERFDKATEVTFDVLENAADRKLNKIKTRNIDGQDIDYQMSLADSRMEDGKTMLDVNMSSFEGLFGYFEEKTGIPIKVRKYQDCQSDPVFRRALLKIINNLEIFTPIVAPGDGIVKLRFPCPECKWVDKASVHTNVISKTEDEAVFEAFCPDHGKHQARLSEESTDYFDTNTPLRDIVKVAVLIEEGIKNCLMPLMIDGRDWSGRWDRCIHVPGVSKLGYDADQLPARIYTPTVMDTLGAKLSKSLYVGDLYDHIPKGFADLNDFMAVYGQDGLHKLFDHIREWARDPAYMDRDGYTILYFLLLLEGKLEKAEIKG